MSRDFAAAFITIDVPGEPGGPAARAAAVTALSGMLQTLDARLAQAAAGDLGHLGFLQVLCEDEISRRESVSLAKRIRRDSDVRGRGGGSPRWGCR